MWHDMYPSVQPKIKNENISIVMYYIIVIVEKLYIVVRRNMWCYENELLKFLYLPLLQQINN